MLIPYGDVTTEYDTWSSKFIGPSAGWGKEPLANMTLLRAPAAAALLATSLFLFTALSLSLDLCDERDCANNTDLEICRPFQDSSNKTPLYLMGFFPCNTRVRARGLTVAAQMAIRAVEKNSSILSNYSMRLSFNNTKVSLD
jgi:hypothetical protein